MRKHGWQLPYHPLQVSSFIFFFFTSSFASMGLARLLLLMFKRCPTDPYFFLLYWGQVVAIAVFLALGFAFYVFFVPFVGKKLFQYVIMGLYTPLVIHFGNTILNCFLLWFSFLFYKCLILCISLSSSWWLVISIRFVSFQLLFSTMSVLFV